MRYAVAVAARSGAAPNGQSQRRPQAPVGRSARNGPAQKPSARDRISRHGAETMGRRSNGSFAGSSTSQREPLPLPGKAQSPSVCTSGSSATPKRSSTRPRPSAITAITSAVVASPVFSMKLACFGAKRAPPTASPLHPASASSNPALRPCARGSSGFLKVEPKVLMPCGCASCRRRRICSRVARTASGLDSEATGSHARQSRRLLGSNGGRQSRALRTRRCIPEALAICTHSSADSSWPP